MLALTQLCGFAAGAAAAAVAYSTLDPATVSNTTLSNGNLTADHDNTTLGGARGEHAKTAGKFYFEVNPDQFNSGDAYGICTTGATYTNAVTNGTNGCFMYATGLVWSNDVNTTIDVGTAGSDVLIGIAVDLDNNKVWMQLSNDAGNWNGDSGSHDPATNTGGFSISNYAATTLMPVAGFSTNATGLAHFNFGGTAFTMSVPSGFTSGWPV